MHWQVQGPFAFSMTHLWEVARVWNHRRDDVSEKAKWQCLAALRWPHLAQQHLSMSPFKERKKIFNHIGQYWLGGRTLVRLDAILNLTLMKTWLWEKILSLYIGTHCRKVLDYVIFTPFITVLWSFYPEWCFISWTIGKLLNNSTIHWILLSKIKYGAPLTKAYGRGSQLWPTRSTFLPSLL